MRCVACGEVHWNLRFGARPGQVHKCRLCGTELSAERRRPFRRFERMRKEGRDLVPPAGSPPVGPRATS